MFVTAVKCYFEETYLNSQVGDDGPLVALQSLQSDTRDFSLRLAHKHLAGCSQHLFVLTLDLHLWRTVTRLRHRTISNVLENKHLQTKCGCKSVS